MCSYWPAGRFRASSRDTNDPKLASNEPLDARTRVFSAFAAEATEFADFQAFSKDLRQPANGASEPKFANCARKKGSGQ